MNKNINTVVELTEKELESVCGGKTVQVPHFPMPQPVPQPTLPQPFEG